MKLVHAICAALAIGAAPAAADPVRIAVGGASCVCYMPTILAEELGLYEKHGVDVELIDFKGGSAALKAVVGGSADVVSGYYEHTILLAAKKQALSAFVLMGRLPGIVLAVAPAKTDELKDVAALAGRTVGVSAPGSSTDFFLKYILTQQGIDPAGTAVVGVGVGATAVAAMEQGRIDAIVAPDPAVSQLEKTYPDLRILTDTRREADTQALFGSDYPGAALYTRTDWIADHPKETQALAAAILDALRYIEATPASEIADRMPANYSVADRDLYVATIENSKEMFSRTGMVDMAAAESVLRVLTLNSPDVAKAGVDLAKTFDNSFVEKATQAAGN